MRWSNFQSGLLGVSEASSDMRDLLGREAQDVRAAEAVALFCYQVKKWIGSFAAAMGGLDTLVFAGGIGENAPVVRARICEGLGVPRNRTRRIAKRGQRGRDFHAGSRVAVRVIHTDEEQIDSGDGLPRSRHCFEEGELNNARQTLFPGNCSGKWMLTGGPPTICRSARYIYTNTPAENSR